MPFTKKSFTLTRCSLVTRYSLAGWNLRVQGFSFCRREPLGRMMDEAKMSPIMVSGQESSTNSSLLVVVNFTNSKQIQSRLIKDSGQIQNGLIANLKQTQNKFKIDSKQLKTDSKQTPNILKQIPSRLKADSKQVPGRKAGCMSSQLICDKKIRRTLP